MADLFIDLFGKHLRNPVMNASGTLGYGREIEPLWPVSRLGAYVTKGLSLQPHHGNPPPRVWEVGPGLINSVGLQNVGIDRFFAEYFPLFKKRRTPIVVNFFGFSDDEYVRCAERIPTHDLVVALEINLSCPNIKQGGICLGKEPAGVFGIIRRVKDVTPLPLIAKLTPEVTNLVDIARAAYEGGADGLTLLNTMPAAAVDVAKRTVPIRGGLSGPPLRPIALRAVSEVARNVPLPIIGAGGIMNATDALSFLMAGASAVQVGTASFIDPYAIPKIIDGLEEYMKKQGVPRIKEIIGVALRQD